MERLLANFSNNSNLLLGEVNSNTFKERGTYIGTSNDSTFGVISHVSLHDSTSNVGVHYMKCSKTETKMRILFSEFKEKKVISH